MTYTVDYEPGMLQVGANNYTFTDVHPTSLRVDPAYSKREVRTCERLRSANTTDFY